MKKRNNTDGVYVLAYIRYILPVLLLCALVFSIHIQSHKFTVVSTDGITGGEVSIDTLLDNSWETVRGYLFGGGKMEGGQKAFSWTVLVLIPLMWALYGIGVLSAVASAVGAIAYFNDKSFKKTDAGVWFITLLPNRIVVSLLQLLVLPLLFYHRILVLLYDKQMNIDVTLDIIGPEPWVLGLIVLAVIFALSAVSSVYEKKYDLDPFKKPLPAVIKVVDREDPENGGDNGDVDEVYEEQKRRAREEQAEYIRRLLNKNNEEE